MAAFADDEEEEDSEEAEEEEEEAGVDDEAGAEAEINAPSLPPLIRPRRRRKEKKKKQKLVGLARLLSDGSFAAHLSDVVVLPSHRQRGIGRALVAAAVDEARWQPGASSSVVSWARPGRPRLFLQRCGFRVSVAYRILRYEGDSN